MWRVFFARLGWRFLKALPAPETAEECLIGVENPVWVSL